jgi:protein-glutamine gamma-glutamyltransferase
VNLSRWLELHTALLAVLGAAFLILSGDRTPFPWALGGAALVALAVTDWYGWFKVPRSLGNLAALFAVAWTFREFWRHSREREAQLLTISHMLIYLQVVLLFQAKTRRVHWQLMVLSVLQVVVAAALALGPQFGALLIVYMMAAIGSMLLLCLQRELTDEHPQSATGKSVLSLHRLLDPPRVVRNPERQDQLARWVRGTWLARGVLMFAAASVAFTVVFFITAPRLSDAQWLAGRGRLSVSGFSKDVELKTSGRVELSDQPVLRASFVREDDRRPVPLVTEPYFHGQVLTDYYVDDSGVARWSTVPRQPRQVQMHQPAEARPGDLVRQEIVLELQQSRLLFSLRPALPLQDTPPGITVDNRRLPRVVRQLSDDQQLAGREFRYTLGTLAIRNGRQLHAVPHFNAAGDSDDVAEERYRMRQFPVERLAGLKRVADGVIDAQGLEDESALARSLALQAHLFGSGIYQYSLEFDDAEPLPPEQANLDPLERFVVHRRRGHCEYFASALVMMLRSQDIPARLVVGYKGGDWNLLGQYYLVRQRHAHAWVEVFLTADEVPPDEIAGTPSGGGAWFRLDPTPFAPGEVEVADRNSARGRIYDVFDYADYLWRDYVLGLNASRQETVLEPITDRSRDLFGGLLPTLSWFPGLAKTKLPDGTTEKEAQIDEVASGATWAPFAWFSGAVLFASLIFAPALLALAARLLRSSAAAFRRRIWGQKSSAPRIWIEFQRLLTKRGVVCGNHHTAQEWAAAAAQELTLAPTASNSASITAILQTVVNSYHRMRFGTGTLSPPEQQELARALGLLRHARPTAVERS